MIRWIAAGVAVIIVALGVMLAVQHRNEPSVPRLVQEHESAPSFALKTLSGSTVDSASLRGKVAVVNFFNSWCIPCRKEAPALAAFYRKHRGEPDFVMVGIVRDDEEAAVRSYAKDEKIEFPVLLDPQGAATLGFGTTGQPETYVIAPDGVVACGTLGRSSVAALDAWLAAAREGSVCT